MIPKPDRLLVATPAHIRALVDWHNVQTQTPKRRYATVTDRGQIVAVLDDNNTYLANLDYYVKGAEKLLNADEQGAYIIALSDNVRPSKQNIIFRIITAPNNLRLHALIKVLKLVVK